MRKVECDILYFVRAELVSDGGPYHIVTLHGKPVLLKKGTLYCCSLCFEITCVLALRSA
jgi:hypothetical protein